MSASKRIHPGVLDRRREGVEWSAVVSTHGLFRLCNNADVDRVLS